MQVKRITVQSGPSPAGIRVSVIRERRISDAHVYQVQHDEVTITPDGAEASYEKSMEESAKRLAPSVVRIIPIGNPEFEPVSVSVESEEFCLKEPAQDPAHLVEPSSPRPVRVLRRRVTLVGTINQTSQ